uniref:hypothetical protein n=1 Tax=Prevotella sp. TaxID=59823 RepID=UPI003FEED6DF
MKKVFTLCVAIMASVATFAQTTLWNGEDKELGTKGGFWDDGSPEVVANPERDGINTSKNCLKFVMTNDKKVVKLPFREWMTPSLQGSTRVSLMIKKSQAENIQIELSDPTDGSEGYWKKVASYYSEAGKWQKVIFDYTNNGSFDNPGLMTITAQTGDVVGEQEVYIDNIQIEPATTVNGQLLSKIEPNSLEGVINLEGTWMKGECQNVDGEWQKVEYNDFATLATKLSGKPANIIMRGCIVKDADINAMRGDNSNILVYADEAYEADNVVKDGKCAKLVLDDTKSFMVNEDFQAANVTLKRSVNAGYNTMCLPFWVSKDDMKAASIATYKEIVDKEDNNSVVTFEKADHIEANVPFVANYNEAVTEFTFTDKGVVNTNNGLGTTFVGTYTPGNVEGKYNLASDCTFKKGDAEATTNAFGAYLELPEGYEAKTLSLGYTDGELAGIESITTSFGNKGVKVYSLQGNQIATASSMSELHLSNGIYIINNKKVVIK